MLLTPNFVQPPLPHFSVTSNLHPNCFFCCPASLAKWVSCHIWCAILLNNNMDLHMSSLGTRRTLMCVLCKNVSGLPRSDICSFLLVLWFDIANKQTHTQHTQRPVDWHTHINEYLHHLLCAQSSCLYYIKWLNFVLKEN